jgi:hypothetical protein
MSRPLSIDRQLRLKGQDSVQDRRRRQRLQLETQNQKNILELHDKIGELTVGRNSLD